MDIRGADRSPMVAGGMGMVGGRPGLTDKVGVGGGVCLWGRV